MEKKVEQIRIDDGSKTYELVNVDGEVIGRITLRPTDTNIVEKYDKVIEALETYFNQMQDKPFEKEDFVNAQKEIVDRFSDLIGEDASKTIFSICGAFTPMASGQLFLEVVIEAIGNIIEKEAKTRMKKVETRMDKYLKGYKK